MLDTTSAGRLSSSSYRLATFQSRISNPLALRDPVIAKLDVECNELAQTWKKFQEHLPQQDQVGFDERLQEFRDVSAMIGNVQNVWMSTPRQRVFNRSMALCDQFISSVHLHLVLLSALPRNEAYIALFHGVLQSVIKASADYPRVIEGLLEILLQINDFVRLPAGDHDLSSNRELVLSIANFYALIFLLLGEFMDWYVRKAKCRLLDSPSLDPYLDFEHLLRSIRQCAKDISRMLTNEMDLDTVDCVGENSTFQYPDFSLWEQARLKQIGLQKSDRRFAAQNALTRQLIWEIQHDASARAQMAAKRDALLSQLLDCARQSLRPVSQQNSGITCWTTVATRDLDDSRFNWSRGPKRKYTRTDLQFSSRHLQDFFNASDQVANFESGVDVIAEDSVLQSLQQWATNTHSQMLAVGESPSTTFPNTVALFSACFATFARQARLPVISHFCSIPTQSTDGLTLFQQGFIALAYSLIRQLIDYLPPVVESHEACDLCLERFTSLNGTLGSWKTVLSLIDALLHYAPPLLVCVINGLDKLQDESTDAYIRDLVRTLMIHTRHRVDDTADGSWNQKVLLKVLFTVADRPSSLVETMSENQLILSEPKGADEPIPTDATPASGVGVVMMNA
ncbi:hypothetical protein ALT_4076 [Aspergillus lentulus]|uniref:DUF7708 domain-containing protein n=1 Tax=Aspergillus lentulus TaxID=293939 RepID=A0AAN4T9V9_ASPLE|nr:uncharacterized protein IFM58399_02233 [Aspergillus lentulus]KAF4160718.1 hypothetical protein CNMCM6069_007503 [Aspergillus lentulus]KAF4178055.1 hypothetical protein CNMCM7927_002773 [Aspergillus lentulus]KAF4180537.1 hypothetical protein CNMCM8060_001230 [Aspergillus lentulus]KAF4191001.1 hypothetical protein CNMCM8694_002592 [Aspergillus lentulus]KAF4210048.1 hypothetical protein CNMCM8927_003313 [Aspergillus lentulus]